MKRALKTVWLLAAASSLLVTNLEAEVTFALTPSNVSNSYHGSITLDIAGLNPGETVVVQKFVDGNTNRTVDSTDWLVQQFQLTDGQASAIGGIINSNIPGDVNPGSGIIRAQLNLLSVGVEQHFVGSYVFKVSSPTGRFGVLASVLTITNSEFSQYFTGTVNCNGTNVPNAAVLMFPGQSPDSSPQAGAIGNNSGGFTLKAAPGTYRLAPVKPNFVTDFAASTLLTLNGGGNQNASLSLLPATRNITGRFVAAANPGVGLPGMMVIGESVDNLLALGFTDTNGNFNLPVTASQWNISLDSASLPASGYVCLQTKRQVDTRAGSVADVTIAIPKATALIYGSLRDVDDQPISGIRFNGRDHANLYEGDGTTDSRGNYAIAVVAGSWNLSPDDSDPILSNYAISQQNNVSIGDGQAVQVNFKGLLATNHISGYLLDTGHNPVANVGVYAYATINGLTFNQYVQTDDRGFYSLGVANGSWNLGVSCGDYDDSLNAHGYQCVNSQMVTIANHSPSVNFTIPPCGPLQVTTSSPLPGAQVGTYYNFPFQATGCNEPFNWSLAPGSQQLPSGLSLSSGGTLAGNPNVSGTFAFSVRVTDNTAGWADQTIWLTINASSPLQVMTGTLLNGTNGTFYSQQFGAAGGQPAYAWSLAPGSADAPPGLSLGSNGLLSGTPLSVGTWHFIARVTDATATTADQLMSLTIYPPPLQVTTLALPSTSVRGAYHVQLVALGGQPPYTWSLAMGSANPPPGLSLDAGGLISGSPATNGLFNFIVQVTDANLGSATQFLGIQVYPRPTLALVSKPSVGQLRFQVNGAVGQSYTLLSSPNLADWSPIALTNAPSDSFVILVDQAPNQRAFFRLQVGP